MPPRGPDVGENGRVSSSPLLVSVVLPCLNEAETLERCVRRARETLAASGLAGEVIVADNGSTDGSQEIARRAGARVVDVPERGYGAALLGGIAAAEGRHVVMGDADDSYDFGEVPAFVAKLEEGNDLVMGSRFRGRIEPGAMPFLHRWLGNPVLSFLGRLFFRVPTSDFHCGIRAFRREALDRLGLKTTGMEFASEMVVKAALFHLRIAEIPVTLRKDGRSRPPHLRTWRDGWRHLRFLLMYSPRWLYLWPGLLLVLLGAGLLAWLFPRPRHLGAATLDVHAMLGAAVMVLAGVEAITFALFAKVFAITEGLLPEDPRLSRLFRVVTLETGLVASALLLLAGAGLCGSVALEWVRSGWSYLDYSLTMRRMIPGALLLVLGAHGLLASFFFSILGLKRR
jgi:glycosyltransferase involved in cell wall biosynthesis